MADKNIILKNVSKSYENGAYAVKDITLQIMPGEFLVLVGPSGCGKSTTLRMIAGLEEMTEGELWIDDVLANFVESGKRDLSMVFQNYALYPNMSVYKNIAFSLEIRGIPKKEVDQKVHETAQLLGIEQMLDRRPGALSGGQRQRVAIANAIIRNPDILLMDEPLSNLDAKLRGQMRVGLARLHKKLKNTIIYVTHDQTEAMSLGTRIVVMKDGVIQQVDTPKYIYEHPINRFVATFIGSPVMNLLDAAVEKGKNGCELTVGGCRIQCGPQLSRRIEKCHVLKDGGTVTVGIRPEDFLDSISVKKKGRMYLTDGQKITVTVNYKEMLGSENILYFEIDGTTCCMKADAENTCCAGDSISIWMDTSKIHLFDRESGENLLYDKRDTAELEGEY